MNKPYPLQIWHDYMIASLFNPHLTIAEFIKRYEAPKIIFGNKQ